MRERESLCRLPIYTLFKENPFQRKNLGLAADGGRRAALLSPSPSPADSRASSEEQEQEQEVPQAETRDRSAAPASGYSMIRQKVERARATQTPWSGTVRELGVFAGLNSDVWWKGQLAVLEAKGYVAIDRTARPRKVVFRLL